MGRRIANEAKVRLRMQSYITKDTYEYLLLLLGDPLEPDKFKYGALGEYIEELISKDRLSRAKNSGKILEDLDVG